MLAPLALLVSQAAAATAPAEIRSLTAAVTDEKGAPVAGLVPEEIAVVENGAAREVTKVELDTRPLTLAILVDTSEPVATSFRLNLIDAVSRFVVKLPEGTRYTLWTTGDRPVKIVDLTDDRGRAGAALRKVMTSGGNTLRDAIGEASRDLKQVEGTRSMVVILTGLGPDTGNVERHQVVDQALASHLTYSAVAFEVPDTPFEERSAYEFILSGITKPSGGLYDVLLSPMGVGQALEKVADDLRAHYRISYATLSEIKNPKLEVTIARPKVKVRVTRAGRAGD